MILLWVDVGQRLSGVPGLYMFGWGRMPVLYALLRDRWCCRLQFFPVACVVYVVNASHPCLPYSLSSYVQGRLSDSVSDVHAASCHMCQYNIGAHDEKK